MNPLLPPAHLDVAGIVRASKSSFLPAFLLLRADRRSDLETFYALCRVADDLADAGDHAPATRLEALEAWREGFRDPELAGLPDNLRGLIKRRSLDPQLFLELLDGVASDINAPVRMATRADLDLYCHRVAGVVGQMCLPIFGADSARAADYAEALGRALQYTNILRDTGSDLARGRLYYPLDELAASGLDAGNFHREHGGRRDFLAKFAADTAQLFTRAASLLPREDRAALRPARVMAAIYLTLLRKMQREGLMALEKRCRLSALEKSAAAAKALTGIQ
ncbi:MAG: squalene/phytoene synthase family protein [Chthoniobacterales bacterium]|nr:squalene/phytoene synthase family protein [Chthoniobacterales bacterium]